MKQYDVSDPFHPRETGSVHIGGIVRRAPHPARPSQPLAGGPQMVEVSRDGNRVYFTNSLYDAWDEQFFPDGVGAWMTKLDVAAAAGSASTRTSSSKAMPSGAAARTRSGSKAATPPATPTATHSAPRCVSAGPAAQPVASQVTRNLGIAAA